MTTQTGLTLAEALASPAFWAYALSASVFGMVSAGLMLFNESVLHEHGFDGKPYGGERAWRVVMLTGMIANFVGGWLGAEDGRSAG